MDLITTCAGVVFGWMTAVAAHFFARDAYASVPRYARRLIERAVRFLPSEDQTRYLEEWLADLNERPAVLSKFRHAVECYLCARKLSLVFRERPSQGWSIRLDNATAAFLLLSLHRIVRGEVLDNSNLDALNALVEEKCGPIDNAALLEVARKIVLANDPNGPRTVRRERSRVPLTAETIEDMLASLGVSVSKEP